MALESEDEAGGHRSKALAHSNDFHNDFSKKIVVKIVADI